MKIPSLPFHNVLGDLLYALFFQGECLGYASLEVTRDDIVSLSVPVHARYAMLVLECDPNQDNKDLVVRFREDGEEPGPDEGMPLGDLGVYEVKGIENMQRFRVLGIEIGKRHKLRIQYFG